VPRISAFYGIAIYMYWQDHEPAHFHAIYSGQEAQVRVSDGEIIAGSLPRTAQRMVREWSQLRRDDLDTDWQRAQQRDTLLPVDGLD
jgi:hypothetical protein